MGSEEEAELAGELELPHLPDMLFLHNRLRCAHASGFHLEVRCFIWIAKLIQQIISLIIFYTVLLYVQSQLCYKFCRVTLFT